MNTSPDGYGEPWLLVSDIDDTLTGDDAALVALADAVQAAGEALIFAVNSSRPSASVARTLAEVFPSHLLPDANITALGTEITIGGAPLRPWQDRFAGWPQEQVFDILSGLGHRAHEAAYQTPFKVSFAVRGEARQEAAREALAAAGIRCQIIASGTDDFDVIPEGAGKGAATLFLARHYGIDLSHLVVSGDSGNDLAMFGVARNRIAVGNARRELIEALGSEPYIHARAHHAAGVHEGLIRLGALPGPMGTQPPRRMDTD